VTATVVLHCSLYCLRLLAFYKFVLFYWYCSFVTVFLAQFWHFLPSVLWHCWLGVRKSICPVKDWVIICMWASRCHCHPIVSCFVKIQIGLTFLVPGYPRYPAKEAVSVGIVSCKLIVNCKSYIETLASVSLEILPPFCCNSWSQHVRLLFQISCILIICLRLVVVGVLTMLCIYCHMP